MQHRARQAATNTAALTGLQARAAMSTIGPSHSAESRTMAAS